MRTGTVQKVTKSKFGWGMLMDDGKWYNSKFEIKCSDGDHIEWDDGGKNYANKVKVLGKTAGDPPAAVGGSAPARTGYSRGVFPVPSNDGSRSIIRQNSVTNAVNLIGHLLAADRIPEDVAIGELIFQWARDFEKYSSGDIDSEVAEEMDKAFEVR